ncbi:GTP-binding protein [Pisolithus croceorrhizus]|nr:GTP-binding protein [Pisolithus croceorrhizus]
MAPGRIEKWFKSLPLAGGSSSRRSVQHGVGDLAPTTTEATTAAASYPTGDVASLVPAQTEAISQATTSSQPAYHLNSKMANEYMKHIKRFRILVMGRANAGKTTILQRVCNSTDKPEIFDGEGNKIDNDIVQGTLMRGHHDIKHELVFKSNPGFVFHDSCGFEAGSTQQFDQMRSFVVDHAATERVNDRVHAIWFCIPMTDYHRTVTAAEKKFFNECDTGHVPVIVLLTKAAEKQGKLLEKWLAHVKDELDKCKYPPKGYVTLQSRYCCAQVYCCLKLLLAEMHQEKADCTVLMEGTANVMNEEGLQMILISTQQSSILLCIEYAVRK